MKILVAEDDLSSLHMLERTLQNQGYEVIPTQHGQEAWRALQSKEPPSIAILDWMMPKMDGLELIGKIRASKLPNYIYIILLTAKSQKSEIIQGIEAGADDYLTKPFDRNELLARLRTGKRIVGLEKKLARNNKRLKAANQDLTQRNSQIKRDLEAAAEIQKTLLPYKTPKAPGVNIEWLYKPCDELAGDILNVFWLDEKHLGIYLIDVSGHGVSAALLAVALNRILIPVSGQSTLVRKKLSNSTRYKIVSPAKVAEQLNQRFTIDESGQYFTLVYGVLNIESRELKFISAGHPTSLYLANSCGVSTFDNTCLPIGFLENETYLEATVCFGRGDRFFLYSDGIIDAINGKNQQFGIERLKEVLVQNRDSSLKNCLPIVNKTVKKWCNNGMTDDISMLALEICD